MQIFLAGNYGIGASQTFRKWILSTEGIEEINYEVYPSKGINMIYLYEGVEIDCWWYTQISKDNAPLTIRIEGDKKEVIDNICETMGAILPGLHRLIVN